MVLGPVGRNFAAGMSGGVAYVWDKRSELEAKCNRGMVDLEHIEGREELAYVRSLVEKHHGYTGSEVAEKVLKSWELASRQFVKVMPRDYKRVLLMRARREAELAGVGVTVPLAGEAERVVAKGVA